MVVVRGVLLRFNWSGGNNWSALAITGPAIRRSLTGGLFRYLALEPEWTMGYGSRLCDP